MAQIEINSKYQTALVCGGGRGIGKAIALALSAQSFDIAVVARTRSELERVCSEVEIAGGKCHIVQADVAVPENACNAVQEANAKLGSIGVLVNCVGAHPSTAPIEEYPLELWDELIRVNLSSVFYLCRQVAPLMKQQRYGRIINISSVAGKIAKPNASAYVAAKHGVIGLSKVLAHELGQWGITVNVVCPGFVETAMTAHKTQLREWASNNAVLGRVVEVDEVASFVTYLVSKEAGAITGQAVNVCCGLVIQ